MIKQLASLLAISCTAFAVPKQPVPVTVDKVTGELMFPSAATFRTTNVPETALNGALIPFNGAATIGINPGVTGGVYLAARYNGANTFAGVQTFGETVNFSGPVNVTGLLSSPYFGLRQTNLGTAHTFNFVAPAVSSTQEITIPNLTSGDTVVFNSWPATLAAKTLTDPIITRILPGADFSITQNSVAAFKSINASATVNSLVLNAGNVGFGTATPRSSAEFYGTEASGPRLSLTNGNATSRNIGFQMCYGATPTVGWQFYTDAAGNGGSEFGIASGDAGTFSPRLTLTPTGAATFAGAVVASAGIELGHATDTTLSRVSAGVVAVEGVTLAFDFLKPLVSTEESITAATTLTGTAFGKMHLCSGTAANYTVTLPAASGNAGKIIGFRMSSALTKLVTLDANASELIDGETVRVLWAQETAVLLCNGTGWSKVMGRTRPMTCSGVGTSPTTMANSTSVKIGLQTLGAESVSGTLSTANARITAQRKSNYSISGMISFEANGFNGAGKQSYIQMYKNGTIVSAPTITSVVPLCETGGNTYAHTAVASTIALNSGDYVEMWGTHTCGTTMSTRNAAVQVTPYLTVIEIPSW